MGFWGNKKDKALKRDAEEFTSDIAGPTASTTINTQSKDKKTNVNIQEAMARKNDIIRSINSIKSKIKSEDLYDELDEVVDNIKGQSLTVYTVESQRIDIMLVKALGMIEKQNYDISVNRLSEYVNYIVDLSKQRSDPSALYQNRQYIGLLHKSFTLKLELDQVKNEIDQAKQKILNEQKKYNQFMEKGQKVQASQCLENAEKYKKSILSKKPSVQYMEEMIEAIEDALSALSVGALRTTTAFMNEEFDGLMNIVNEITQGTTMDLKNVSKLKEATSKFKSKLDQPSNDIKSPDFADSIAAKDEELEAKAAKAFDIDF